MTPATLALIQFAVKFGLDAALILANAFKKGGVTIDDAIAALEMAKTKTAADYLAADAAASAAAKVV